MVVTPQKSTAMAPIVMVFSFVHAISFSVVLRRARIEGVMSVPLMAATVTDAASPIGAA